MARIAVGTVVRFAFDLERVSLSQPRESRSGHGVIISDEVYTVWPAPGYAVRVTESPDYPAGTVVYVCRASVWRLAPAVNAGSQLERGQPVTRG